MGGGEYFGAGELIYVERPAYFRSGSSTWFSPYAYGRLILTTAISYPHTAYSVLAIGLYMNDVDDEMGPAQHIQLEAGHCTLPPDWSGGYTSIFDLQQSSDQEN